MAFNTSTILNKKNMKGFIISFQFLFIFNVPSHAQIASEANSYRRGDKVERLQVAYMPLEENGQHAVWNLSGMEAMNNTAMRFIGEEADSNKQVVCIAQSRRMPYTLSGDSLLIDGYEDYTTRMNYDLKEAWLQFPMYYGQSSQAGERTARSPACISRMEKSL